VQFNAVVEPPSVSEGLLFPTNTAAVVLWRSLGFRLPATVPEAFVHPRHGLVGLHVRYRRLGD
jgi:hypothetical protein